MVVLEKIAETVDFKASDYPKMEEALSAAIAYEFGNDLEKDGEEYLNEFHLCERLLMIAQRQNLRDGEQLNGVIKVDLNAFFQHFMQFSLAFIDQKHCDRSANVHSRSPPLCPNVFFSKQYNTPFSGW